MSKWKGEVHAQLLNLDFPVPRAWHRRSRSIGVWKRQFMPERVLFIIRRIGKPCFVTHEVILKQFHSSWSQATVRTDMRLHRIEHFEELLKTFGGAGTERVAIERSNDVAREGDVRTLVPCPLDEVFP